MAPGKPGGETVGEQQPARERLIDAAFALFDERGFENTTVEDIAERAAVGRTTFFRNFRSKDDVIFPDHDRRLAAVRDRFCASTPDAAAVAISEAARLVLQSYLDEGPRARSRYALTSTVPALRDREKASIQAYQRLFRDFIAQWRGQGEGSDLRAELMANAVVTAHNHVLRRWLRGETDAPEREFDAAMDEVFGLFREHGPGATAPGSAAVLVVRTARDLDAVLPRIRGLLE